MDKAVWVMDMPESCADCQLADDDPGGLYCPLADEYYDGADGSEDRASFCPLRGLPEKKEELPVEKYEFGGLGKAFASGWNTCLDKILR